MSAAQWTCLFLINYPDFHHAYNLKLCIDGISVIVLAKNSKDPVFNISCSTILGIGFKINKILSDDIQMSSLKIDSL
jgi:hypothetical protein